MDRLVTDVLVIGGGGAALRAALAACDAGADVIIAAKMPLGLGGPLHILWQRWPDITQGIPMCREMWNVITRI
ncbi:MAG: FAD-binding protein [Enterocloster sp.]